MEYALLNAQPSPKKPAKIPDKPRDSTLAASDLAEGVKVKSRAYVQSVRACAQGVQKERGKSAN
jgi:hypothetical protein